MLEVVILPMAERYFLHTLGMLLLALLWIVKRVLLGSWQAPRTPLDIPILLFVAWGLLSALTSTHPRYSLGAWRTEMVTQLFFFYLGVTHLRERTQARAVHGALMVGSALMACAGIHEFLSAGGSWDVRTVRIGALSSDYNYASSYFVIVVPMILYGLMTAAARFQKGLFGLLLGANLLALYFTFTRAAWLGLIASFLMLGLLIGKRVLMPMAALLGLLILLLIATPQGATFYRNMGGADDLGRLSAWSFGMEQIAQHPLLGIGYGRENLRMSFPGQPGQPGQIDAKFPGLWHLHNTFLETTLEMGLPGGVLLLLILLLLLSLFIRGYGQARCAEDRGWMLSLILMTVAYSVRNQFDHLYVDAPALLFWILAGLGMSRVRLISEEADASSC
jgi:heptosyltransferase-3/putative inorganic carbon (HCO3(-)) transporter